MSKILNFLILLFAFTFSLASNGSNLDLSPEVIKKAIKEASNPANNENTIHKVFIIKVNHQSVLTGAWARKACSETAEAIVKVYGNLSESHCFLDDSEHLDTLKKIESEKIKLNADFQVNLDRRIDSKMDVTIINLKQKDTNYTNKFGWRIEFDTLENFKNDLSEKLNDSYLVANNPEVIRDVLVDLIYSSYNEKFKKEENISREELYTKLKKSGKWTPKTRKFLIAGSELLASLSFGRYAYYNLSSNSKDYDYQKEGVIYNLKNKLSLGDRFRFDDNSWGVNRDHVFAGVGYYLVCRGAGLTALEAYMCSMAGSMAWENLIEWREVFSINDQIFTSTGGAILAESVHQLGKYIDQKAPPWFRNTIGWAWKGPKKLGQFSNDKLLEGNDSDLESEEFNLSGKFEFEVGTYSYSNGVQQKRVGINSEVVTIPFYLEPGREVKFIRDVVETNFKMNGEYAAFFDQYDLFAKLVMAAYYNKNLGVDKNNQLTGYSFYIGPSAALDLKNDQISKNDFMGIVHVIGTTAKLVNFYKGLKITSTLDIWGDSVMMHSMLVEDYKNQNPAKELIGNLDGSNYYHGFGLTSKGQIILEFNRWAVGATLGANSSMNTNSRQRTMNKEIEHLNISRSNYSSEIFIERIISDSLKVSFAIDRDSSNENIENFGSVRKINTTRKISLTYYF
jgi:hypothetical protein